MTVKDAIRVLPDDEKVQIAYDYTDTLFYELKDLYEKHGYRVVPVGIVGGVRQRDYYITW